MRQKIIGSKICKLVLVQTGLKGHYVEYSITYLLCCGLYSMWPCQVDLCSLWSMSLSCLLNVVCPPPHYPHPNPTLPVCIVLPAVLCCSCLSLWNVHLHHLSLTGKHAMCCLIDGWICFRRRSRLSHGSVCQNKCEQKWGHLERIRNCEEKKRKKKHKIIWMCFRWIRVPCVCRVFIWRSVSG